MWKAGGYYSEIYFKIKYNPALSVRISSQKCVSWQSRGAVLYCKCNLRRYTADMGERMIHNEDET